MSHPLTLQFGGRVLEIATEAKISKAYDATRMPGIPHPPYEPCKASNIEMDIEIATSVIEDLLHCNRIFDSHAFIRAFIKTHPSVYGQMLIEYDNVTVAHSVIANFLLNNSKELGIERMNEDNMSRDIFDIETPCAGWRVLTIK